MANVPLKSLKFPGLGNKYTVDSLTTDIKSAILQIASKVAYIDEHGQDYYDDLYNALYPPASTFTVTNALTNCTTSNAAVAATEGDSYSAIITADQMYSLDGATVSITMGGIDITSIAYSNGSIDISAVTGAIVITIAAVAVTVESISAVYTQSGTVYDTDTLDSLKSDLVVTATYSDSSTATVPSADYTLSGTLTAGTSTITVTYGGKTDTFNVTVIQLVPSEYTPYDYIKRISDSGSQESNAKMIHLASYDNLNRIGIKFPVVSTKVQPGVAIIGGRPSSGSASSFAFYSGNKSGAGVLGYHLHGVDSTVVIPFGTNEIHEISYLPATESPTYINLDGDDYQVTWSNDNTIATYLTLFANQVKGTGTQRISADIQLGRIQISDINGAIISDYVPCVRNADNVIGMYDRIGAAFYTSGTASYSTIGDANCTYAVGNW